MHFSLRDAALARSSSSPLPWECVMRCDDDSLTGLEDARRGRQPRRRRSLSSGGAIYHLHARNGSRAKAQSARAAAAYIQRAGAYGRDQADELVYTESGHMPAWAAGAPTAYWAAADKYERANGRLFKGVEVALPLALTEEEQRELAVGFAHHLTDGERLPYTLAIHAGAGTNPHAHLLISERGNDGLERSPEQWFRRFNAATPEQGGARKSRALQPKAWLEDARAAWAAQTNQALERAGHAVRIDHRSLEAQGIERLPSLHLGPTVAAMEARGIATERGTEARHRAQVNAEREQVTAELAQVNAALVELKRQQEAAPPPRRRPPLKERVGTWFSREQAPEAPAGPRPSSPAPAPVEAETTPPARVSGAEAARGQRGAVDAERKSLAYVLEHYEEVAAKVAAIEDPAQRAEAERHLRAIREEAATRETRQQERERKRERERDRDEGLER